MPPVAPNAATPVTMLLTSASTFVLNRVAAPSRPRAFIRRASTNFGLHFPHWKPLDPFPQTAGVSFRISYALWTGRTRSSHLPHQHDGVAYAELAGGPSR